jgi:succinate-acetate transporter protein
MILLETGGLLAEVPTEGLALFLIAWGIFTAYATVVALRTSWGVFSIFATLTVLFFLLAWGEYNHTVKIIAGYEGILCALIAWHCAAAILINSTFGRDVLTLGHIGPRE